MSSAHGGSQEVFLVKLVKDSTVDTVRRMRYRFRSSLMTSPTPGFLKELMRRARMPISGRPATLNGRVLFEDSRGIQTIGTDSSSHPIVKCLGATYIRGARPGDKVRLTYRLDIQIRGEQGMIGRWYGEKIA